MAGRKKQTAEKEAASPLARRSYLSQTEVPAFPLDQALRVPAAIFDHYAGKATSALRVASAMEIQPSSSQFRMLCGAAIAYGLTVGGYNASEVAATELAKRILRPTHEADDFAAMREALLKPRVVGQFLRRYNGSPVPRRDIAQNVLRDMDVPDNRVAEVLDLVLEGAKSVGFLHEIKGKPYVDLQGAAQPASEEKPSETEDDVLEEIRGGVTPPPLDSAEEPPSNRRAEVGRREDLRSRRVFISHGRNQEFIAPIRKLLGFGELEAIVAVEEDTVSQPVPQKVLNAMRGCGAAIIHLDAEQVVAEGEEQHVIPNPNVLIEIGAAMALYGRRFILLVKEGMKLPSNLQGLFQVRYKGDTLDGEATIRLMEAINDIKNHELPGAIGPEAS